MIIYGHDTDKPACINCVHCTSEEWDDALGIANIRYDCEWLEIPVPNLLTFYCADFKKPKPVTYKKDEDND